MDINPKTRSDIKQQALDKMLEEMNQEHSPSEDRVSSYTERHLKGQTMIVFVRLSSSPNIPLYTLEVKSGEIVQFRAKYNRDVPNEVWDVAKKWLRVTKQEKVA